MEASSMLIAQISDVHVRGERADGTWPGNTDTPAAMARCVARLNGLAPRPDVVLVTGDLVHGGQAADYALLLDLLTPLDIPFFVVPGNHDDRANLRAAFRERGCPAAAGHFLNYVIEDFPVRLVALDTQNTGHEGGRLCEERLAWLETCLNERPDQPTVVFMHHPPFLTGLAGFDREPLQGADGLADIIRRHPSVERILCGHLHRPVQGRFAGTLASSAPSSAFQVALDLTEGVPLRVVPDPAAFQLHRWQPGTGIISHTGYV
ncbi:MAG: phosphodiesterase [Alphaproteobacteria bacterium]